MPVSGVLSYTLNVPDVSAGVKFYTDAGLEGRAEGNVARLHCAGQDRDSVILIGGAKKKALHHITLRADGLDEIAAKVPACGGSVVEAPQGFEPDGLWVRDMHGMLIHLVDQPRGAALEAVDPFQINQPGHMIRVRRSAILASALYPPVKPLRLGHVLLFTPNTPASVAFMVDALGMGLADQAQGILAFCCARKDSDHHVVAFGQAGGVGFHHGSFQVADPDQVGRGGAALLAKSGRGDWGFGRHTVGSNFFHYIQDPWGSWFEYYSDMDFIDDYDLWTPTNYGLEDSLANWGPSHPDDFITNYETDAEFA